MSRTISFEWGLGLIGAAGILFGTMGESQAAPTTPPATVSTNVQDYGQGFRAFIRMGLPDTSKAKYVKLDYYCGRMPDIPIYGMNELQLSGNAWLVSENKDDKSVLVSSSGRMLELYNQMSFSFNEMGETGSWIPVDLSRDLAKATAFVDKKIKAKAAGGQEMRWDSFRQSDEPAGVLFMLAAFAWQNGKTQEANVLAGRLFMLVGDSRKVIVGALNIMADAQLIASGDAFRKTGNWKAYHTAVSGLLKKYPAGWRQAGAAKLLADRLRARAAMAEPPAVTGEGLGEEDLKLAAALASETNQAGMHVGESELWILPPAKAMREMKDGSVIGCIKARWGKSIPLLIALVPDETLCPLWRNEVGFPIVMSYPDSDARKSEAERAQFYYNRMDRPLTRGEIARALLAPLCRRDENAWNDELAPEEVIEEAKQAYATLKTLAPSALALHFLENGDRNQKQAAVSHMLQNNFEINAPVIEAYLLTPPSDEPGGMMIGSDNGLAQQYVGKRGEKAAEFVEKYAAMRKKIELPAGLADNVEYVKQMEKQIERELKTLRAMVKKQDLSAAVFNLANSVLDKLTDAESLYLMEAASENEVIAKALALLSRRIVAVKTPPALPAAETARLRKLAGTTISTNAIAEMREFCTRQLATGSAMAVTLTSGGLGKGLSLAVTFVDDKASGMFGYDSMLGRMGSGGRKGMVMGMLRSGQNNSCGMWLVDLPAPKAAGMPTGTVAEASGESEDKLDDQMFGTQQEQFESAVEAFCTPGESIGPGTLLSFTGMMPPIDSDKKKDSGD
ncbi:MAG: hypothetical protein WCO77_07010 [bacterium]